MLPLNFVFLTLISVEYVSGDILPGLGFIGFGYNILFGNPQSEGETDPGYRELIFDITNTSNGQTLHGYTIPNGINAIDAESCDSNFQYQAMSGTNSYSDILQISVSTGTVFQKTAFSLSPEYQHVYKQTTNTSSLYTSSFTRCTVYRATLNAPFNLPQFSSNFISSIKNMPISYQPLNISNKEYFYTFINSYFGTHYLLSIELGGIYGGQYEMDSYSFSSFSSSNLSISASCGFAIQSTFDIDGMTSSEKTEAMDFKSVTTDESIYYLGGSFPVNGSWQKWAETLKNSSMPIVITLDEIPNLLISDNFPSLNDTISDKQNALKQAINDYCYQVSMDNNYNKSLTIKCDGFPPDKALPNLSIFGGSYPSNKYGIINPYTSGINCADGYKPYSWIEYIYDDGMVQYVCINDTQLIHYKHDAMYYFGGMYSYKNSPTDDCQFINPFTNNCSCPKGMNSSLVISFIDHETNHFHGEICYNASIKLGRTILGSLFQTGHISTSNVYTKTQSCPHGYQQYQISHFHDDGHTGEHKETSNLYMCSNNIYKLQ